MNKSKQMEGDVFFALARDISRSGMSFVCEQSVTAELLAIQLDIPEHSPVFVVMQVKRWHQRAEFFEVAGVFLERLTSVESIAKLCETQPSLA